MNEECKMGYTIHNTHNRITLRLPKNISSSYNIEIEYQIIRTTEEILQQFEVELRIKLFNIYLHNE
jgi:hypothetical protein